MKILTCFINICMERAKSETWGAFRSQPPDEYLMEQYNTHKLYNMMMQYLDKKGTN